MAAGAVFTLVLGALGAGGLAELVDSLPRPELSRASSRTTTDVPSQEAERKSGTDKRELSAEQVMPPTTAPDGRPQQGRAPEAKTAGGGKFPSFRPTLLQLPSGTDARIQPAGVRSDGSLEVPELPSQVGWWTGGSQAGEPFGTVVLAGHVDSRVYGVGALAQMKQMKRGDVVTLRGGGQKLRYRVVDGDQVPQAELNAQAAVFDQSMAHRLVLITCGGAFDRRTHRYTENVILIAKPLRG